MNGSIVDRRHRVNVMQPSDSNELLLESFGSELSQRCGFAPLFPRNIRCFNRQRLGSVEIFQSLPLNHFPAPQPLVLIAALHIAPSQNRQGSRQKLSLEGDRSRKKPKEKLVASALVSIRSV